MRTKLTGLAAVVMALMAPVVAGLVATPASAAEGTGTICSVNSGSIKLSPGLEEVAHVQNITIKGSLSGCTGSTVTGATYVGHLKTTHEVNCAALRSAGEAATGTIVIKWAPKGQGNSHGTLSLPLTVGTVTMGGKLESGPFEKLVLYDPVSEAFTGACGVKKKVKDGSLTGSQFRVASPPTATISSPAGGGVYVQNAVVPTTFSCAESAFGPGLESCSDSNGASGGAGTLETATLGEHTYTVKARSLDGLSGRASIHYEVVEA